MTVGVSIFILVSIYHFANNTPKPWSTKYFSCSTRLYTTDYWLLIRVARTRTRKAFVGRFHKVRLDIYFKPRLLISPRPLKCWPSKWPRVLRFVIKGRFSSYRTLFKKNERKVGAIVVLFTTSYSIFIFSLAVINNSCLVDVNSQNYLQHWSNMSKSV